MTSETLQSSNISSSLRCGSSAQLVPRASQILQTAGIDMDVLMALPEDMRGEVVLQQIQGMDFSALRAQVRREGGPSAVEYDIYRGRENEWTVTLEFQTRSM